MKKVICIILIIFILACCMGIGYVKGKDKGYNVGYSDAKTSYESKVNELSVKCEILESAQESNKSKFYYKDAYIFDQKKLENDVYEVTWYVNYYEVQCFVTHEKNRLDENYTYLLTMYGNETSDPADDVVVAIWKAM